MKYNTPKQRKKIYEHLLRKWEKGDSYNGFICGDIEDLIGYTDDTGDYEQMLQLFPEFLAQKPKRKSFSACWWRTDRSRINALKAAIKLCDE